MWQHNTWGAPSSLTWSHNPYTTPTSMTFDPISGEISIDPLSTHKILGYNEEDIPNMKLEEYRNERVYEKRYAVSCNDEKDLSQERILKSISVMKSKIMMACAPRRVDRIECKMTPAVKANMINAYRKINMYGKKTPFVACFDEYGRRLSSDEVKIDTIRGMNIEIIDPAKYGAAYISFEAVIPKDIEFTTSVTLDEPTYISGTGAEVPF